MEEENTRICEDCGSSVLLTHQHCPACGYEFSTRRAAVGDFTFGYPAVSLPYTPSGETTESALFLMGSTALIGGALIGGLAWFWTWTITYYAGTSAPPYGVVGLIALIVIYTFPFILPSIGGLIVGFAIGVVGERTKNRNVAAALTIGAIGGLIAGIVFVLIWSVSLHWREPGFGMLYSKISIAVDVIVPLLAVVLSAAMTSSSVFGSPFCEECEDYMLETQSGTYPIRYEKQIIDGLLANDPDQLAALQPEPDQKNFMQISTWHCSCPDGTGYVAVDIQQMRKRDRNGWIREETRSRRVFAHKLPHRDVLSIYNLIKDSPA
jgi:hypothetical protein